MTSLDQLQKTIAMLNTLRGATLGIQTTVEKVTSVVRDSLGVVDTIVDALSSSFSISPEIKVKPLVSVIPTLKIDPTVLLTPRLSIAPELNINPKVNIAPELNITPVVNINPQLNIKPKLNITPVVNIAPKLNFKPELNVSPKLNITPVVNINPQLNIKPKLNITPVVNIAPKLNFKPELNVSPKLNIQPELNIAPKLNIQPELNIAPKLNIQPELNIAPKLNIQPELNIAPKLNIKPELNIAPKLNIKPTVNFAPTLNLKPTINVSPHIKVAPRVSLVGTIFGALKGSVMAFVNLIRVSALSAFTLLRVGMLSVLPAVFAFSAALLANPITWVVAGIVALVAAIVGLIVYWDEVTAAVGNFFSNLSSFFSSASNLASANIFEPLKTWWSDFSGWLAGLDPFAAIAAGWDWIKSLFAENSWLQTAFFPIYAVISIVDGLLAAFDKIPQWWASFKAWLSSLNPLDMISGAVDKVKSAFSWIPGMGSDDSTEVVQKAQDQQQDLNHMVRLPGAETLSNVGDSGLMQTISNEFGGQKKSTQVDKIEVHNHGTGVRGDDIAYELEMVAG